MARETFSLSGLIFGHDLFISYRHGEGDAYAQALATQLKGLDFSCFLDRQELHPGLNLDGTIEAALKRSHMFVVIATETLFDSTYVPKEIRAFPKKDKIIPINIRDSLKKLPAEEPWPLLSSVIWIEEPEETYREGVPSASVLEGIKRAFKARRRNVIKRALVVGAGAVLLILSGVAATFGYIANVEAGRRETAVQGEQTALVGQKRAQQERDNESQQREQAVADKELESKAKEKALKDKEIETKAKEKAVNERQEALVREQKAWVQARENELLAERREIDKQVDRDALLPHGPLETSRWYYLDNLYQQSLRSHYPEGAAQIRSQLACLPDPQARSELMPPADARLSVVFSSNGTRLVVAYTNRVEIVDAVSLRIIHTHSFGSGLVLRTAWMKADPYSERVFLEGEYDLPEGTQTANSAVQKQATTLLVVPLDGTTPSQLKSSDALKRLQDPKVVTNYLSKRLGRVVVGLASEPDWQTTYERLQARIRGLREKLRLDAKSHVVPLAYGPEGRTGLYEVYIFQHYLPFPEWKTPFGTFRLPTSGIYEIYPIFYDDHGRVKKLAEPPAKPQPAYIGDDDPLTIDTNLWGDLNLSEATVLTNHRLIRFSGDSLPRAFDIDLDWKTVKNLEFAANGLALVGFQDGSTGLFDLNRNVLLHRFLNVSASRGIAVDPQGTSVLLLRDDGRLESWRFSAFGPKGWGLAECPAPPTSLSGR